MNYPFTEKLTISFDHVSIYSGDRMVLRSSFKLARIWRGPKLLTPMKFKSCSKSYNNETNEKIKLDLFYKACKLVIKSENF